MSSLWVTDTPARNGFDLTEDVGHIFGLCRLWGLGLNGAKLVCRCLSVAAQRIFIKSNVTRERNDPWETSGLQAKSPCLVFKAGAGV